MNISCELCACVGPILYEGNPPSFPIRYGTSVWSFWRHILRCLSLQLYFPSSPSSRWPHWWMYQLRWPHSLALEVPWHPPPSSPQVHLLLAYVQGDVRHKVRMVALQNLLYTARHAPQSWSKWSVQVSPSSYNLWALIVAFWPKWWVKKTLVEVVDRLSNEKEKESVLRVLFSLSASTAVHTLTVHRGKVVMWPPYIYHVTTICLSCDHPPRYLPCSLLFTQSKHCHLFTWSDV